MKKREKGMTWKKKRRARQEDRRGIAKLPLVISLWLGGHLLLK